MNTERKSYETKGYSVRPALARVRRDILVTETTHPRTREKCYYVKLLKTNDVFQLGEEEYFVCTLLDGTKQYAEISQIFKQKFGIDIKEEKYEILIQDLEHMGLLETPADSSDAASKSTDADDGERANATAGRETAGADEGGESGTDDLEFRKPYHLPLLEPSGLLVFLARMLRPFRFLLPLLPGAVLLAGLVMFHRQEEMTEDLARVRLTLVLGMHVLLSLFTVNFISKLALGIVASSFGASPRQFGLRLVFGLIPKFYVEMKPIWDLPRTGRLWSFAAPLLAKLVIFSAGILLWIGFRSSGTQLPLFALLLSQMALGAFFFTANPLWTSDGFAWLAAYLKQPKLRERALRYFVLRLRGKSPPPAMSGFERFGLISFALAIILFFGLLVSVISLYLGMMLEERWGGTGVIMFTAVVALFCIWLLITRYSRKRQQRAAKAESSPQPTDSLDKSQDGSESTAVSQIHSGSAAAQDQEIVVTSARTLVQDGPNEFYYGVRRRPSIVKRIAVLAVLGTVLALAFAPYPYQMGGPFVVLPSSRIGIHTRVDGEVMEILKREGQWVEAGDVLAVLSNWDEERGLAVIDAELDKARANLKLLESSPSPEALAIAQKEVGRALIDVRYSEIELNRSLQLVKTGAASQKSVDQARAGHEASKAAYDLAVANLALVERGPLESELDAARAEIRRIEREKEYRQSKLFWTRVRAPAAGRIITPNLHLILGTYLPEGGLLAELEDDRMVQVEIEIPETDVADLKLDSSSYLKAWGHSDTTLEGAVVAIAPVAEEREFGKIVRVLVELPNPDGLLRTGMTGFGKVQGPVMPAWQAFTRMIVRFFRIEVWSWIP